MNVLILGGHGMAGHMILNYFRKLTDYQLSYTHRDPKDTEGIYLDVRNESDVRFLIQYLKPDVVINCVGILNENATNNIQDALKVNSLLPHLLQNELTAIGAKLIHISSDCVFEGEKGSYLEADPPNGKSTYARTKALGEVIEVPHLTVRTSIIGPEKKDGIGLFHWFMKQHGNINGYVNVHWNGITTLELAKSIHFFIEENVTGLYHLTAPEVLSKHTLLTKIQTVFEKKDVIIHTFKKVVCDRTLLNTRYEINYKVPTYDEMLIELRDWTNENGVH